MTEAALAAPPRPRAKKAATRVRRKWGAFEWFLVVVFLGSGLVFIPGTQMLRPVVRGLPYAMSLAVLAVYLSEKSRRKLAPAARLVIPALALYAVNLLHPFTDAKVGLATLAFTVAVLAPVFWAGAAVRDRAHFHRLLRLLWAVALVNVVVGILQAAFPIIFTPATLSGDAEVLSMQRYMGPFGQEIIRPPGLTDLPGGASFAGMVTCILGLALAVRKKEPMAVRLAGLLSVGGGFFILYLTQVRSLAVLTVLTVAVFAGLSVRQARSRWLFGLGLGLSLLVLLIGPGTPAFDPENPYAPGGRFQAVLNAGLFDSFMENRGKFLMGTFNDLVWRYPLGAGLGRWGMMREYFGDGSPFSLIWVEVQPTGWLLDGGIPMWILYGGALVAAISYSLRLALRKGDDEMAYFASIVLCIQLIIAGMTLAGPVFNTVFGVVFWLLTAGLHGVAESPRVLRRVRARAAAEPVPVGS